METTSTTKGQVVIPSAVRRKLGIKAGTRFSVEVNEENTQIILTPITREYIKSMAGKFRDLPLIRIWSESVGWIGSVRTASSITCSEDENSPNHRIRFVADDGVSSGRAAR